MLPLGRPAAQAVLALAGALAGCGFSASYDGTHYRCGEAGGCPDGFTCVDEVCIVTVAADRDAAAGDAASATMLTESSRPELPIPDDSFQGITDEVEFSDSCAIDDIQVDMFIIHEWRGDLVISLTSPSNTEVDLHEFIDNESEDDIVGTYPTTLTPVESLDAFLGEDGAGTWTLEVADVDDQDLGTLRSWAVHLWCD